jgi:hypothetical protein
VTVKPYDPGPVPTRSGDALLRQASAQAQAARSRIDRQESDDGPLYGQALFGDRRPARRDVGDARQHLAGAVFGHDERVLTSGRDVGDFVRYVLDPARFLVPKAQVLGVGQGQESGSTGMIGLSGVSDGEIHPMESSRG